VKTSGEDVCSDLVILAMGETRRYYQALSEQNSFCLHDEVLGALRFVHAFLSFLQSTSGSISICDMFPHTSDKLPLFLSAAVSNLTTSVSPPSLVCNHVSRNYLRLLLSKPFPSTSSLS
jgi:hypothetical protein